MHQPRPHGQLAVGGAPTDDDSAAIELLARRLTNLRQLSGVDSLRMVRSLPDGGYVIAQDMGGTFKTITHKPLPPEPPPPFDGVAKDYLPMLFSGAVTRAVLAQGEGLGMKLTDQARRRINGYKPENLPPSQVTLRRFAVEYHSMVSELAPDRPGERVYTQYVAQRPTWYSGAMAQVMQIVGGYGRQDLSELPENAVERARMLIPEPVRKTINEQMGSVRLPGYTGLPVKNGQFQYDYKFNNTHGVGFDSDGRPWLLRVSTAGVHAMPLPLVPASTTLAFRTWMEDEGDQEILAILDRFGGMPSGEGFPAGSNAFEAWRRAGVIIKVCGDGGFYQHIMYSSAVGWSFNSIASEGFNTCYDYYDSTGLGYGMAFKLSLFLRPSVADGKLPPTLKPEDPLEARKLDTYLADLYRQMNDTNPEHLAIKYKLRRVPVGDLLSRASSGQAGAGELDYWNALVLEPIAEHNGSIAEVSRGFLYHGAKFASQPQIKFPEPFMKGCISHDFLPLEKGIYQDFYPNSDTIMFGYYANDALKVVKYFREGRVYFRDIDNNYDACMTVGSWRQTETEGMTTLVGYFYTSDIDERRELAPVTTVTTIDGQDKGFDTKPWFSFDYIFSRVGTIWRERYFTHLTKITRSEGQFMSVAVCVPYLNRDTVLHAKREGTTGGRYTESLGLNSVRDPNSYRYETYDRIWAWSGGDFNGNVYTAKTATPGAKDGNPVWVMGYNYYPSECSDFADQGDWLGGLPQDYTWLIHPVRSEWHHSGGGGPPAVNAYSKFEQKEGKTTGELQYSFQDLPEVVHMRVPDDGYFRASPDDFGNVFYRDGCRITFGSAEYTNVSENEADTVGSLRKRWGFSNLVDHKTAHHFIGVING